MLGGGLERLGGSRIGTPLQGLDQMEPEAGRQLIESVFSGGMLALDPDQEYELRHPDYVMEMPQSRERIRGPDKMRAMQNAFPRPPAGTLRRVTGSGDVWVAEGTNDYGDGDVWQVIIVFELKDGKILRETRYYAQPFEPAEWRAAWVELMEEPQSEGAGASAEG